MLVTIGWQLLYREQAAEVPAAQVLANPVNPYEEAYWTWICIGGGLQFDAPSLIFSTANSYQSVWPNSLGALAVSDLLWAANIKYTQLSRITAHHN